MMFPIDLKRLIPYGLIALLACLLIAACTSNTGSNPVPTHDTVNNPASTQQVLVQGTSIASSPGVGPTVILAPTRVPGGDEHSQLVTLPDRILTITSVSKHAGTDSNSIAIHMTITIKNTSVKSIHNDATYFQLTSSEGDAFGLLSNAAPNFFGTIASLSSRSSTITFQVPVGAVNGMHLLYRPEVATETTFVPLNLK